MSSSDAVNCGRANNADTYTSLRIGSIFVILATSLFGTIFPVVSKRSWKIPTILFDFIKYFGSGVIIATGFIHLLAPAFEELTAQCVTGTWQTYPFAAAFAMASVFALFFAELFAFRWGANMLENIGMTYDVHAGPSSHTHVATGPGHSGEIPPDQSKDRGEPGVTAEKDQALDSNEPSIEDLSAPVESKADVLAQIVAISILEFGVVFHSFIIGLTLAVNQEFKTLFIVVIFHQMFEGLGLGSRLAYLVLPKAYNWVPFAGGILYSLATPIGVSIGLGVRSTYNPDSMTANLVTGTLDSISAGILLYTGLVELLAHEFLFNTKMHKAPIGKVLYAGACILLGAGIMSLLGRWA